MQPSLPALFNVPSTASPTYGLEHIVERVEFDDDPRWWYRVERRVRRHTTPVDEQEDEVLSARARAARSRSSPVSTSGVFDAEARSASTTSSSAEREIASTRSPNGRLYQTFLVKPEDILDHVSAAELEQFENDYVREQQRLEEASRQAFLESKWMALERKREIAANARAAKLEMQMRAAMISAADSVESESSGSAEGGLTINGRRKRKAGEAALDRLAAMPWTVKAFERRPVSATTASSSSPKPVGRPRGRPKGSGKRKETLESLVTPAILHILDVPASPPAPPRLLSETSTTSSPLPTPSGQLKCRPKGSEKRQATVEASIVPAVVKDILDVPNSPPAQPRALSETSLASSSSPKPDVRPMGWSKGNRRRQEIVEASILPATVGDILDVPDSPPNALASRLLSRIPALDGAADEVSHDTGFHIYEDKRSPTLDPVHETIDDAKDDSVDDFEQEYEIEALVDDWVVDDVRWFEVAWEGYPGENTAEIAKSLPPEIVQDYDDLKHPGSIFVREDTDELVSGRSTWGYI